MTTHAVLLAILVPAPAAAAPPVNDQRSNAQAIALPASLTGTTTESKLGA
jgi:hypothetical protein